MDISKKISNINESLTTEIFNQINELKNENVISFTAGDPYCDISNKIKRSAIKALFMESNHYTNTIGMNELRKAIAKKIYDQDHVKLDFKNIIISNGAKQCLYNSLSAILNPNDEVIIFNPSWRAYTEMVKLLDGIPKYLELEKIDKNNLNMKELHNLINEKTKAIIINNPNNPTGKILDKKVIKEILKIAVENDVYVISDEVYREFVYDNMKFCSLNSLINEQNKKNIIVINSFSKSHSLAGWRIGYMNVPLELIDAIKKIQSYTTSNVNTLTQMIGIDAVSNNDKFVKKLNKKLYIRRNIMFNGLKEIRGFKIEKMPEGAFYIWANIEEVQKDSKKFCERLLKDIKVALVPGVEFGKEGYVRISYSKSIKEIKEGISRLKEYMINWEE